MRDDDDDRQDYRRGPAPVTPTPKAATRDELWAAEQRRAEAARRAQAIAACNLCDTDGYRCDAQGHRLAVCDHVDRTETNQRGIQAVRAALANKGITPP